MSERISVIVPVHNGETYLEQCIASILAQAYEELEVLIINDGSTDSTADICERLCRQYACLRTIELPDLGVSAARNSGLEQAQGDYMMFVDADDRLRPGVLRGLHDILLETDSDLAGCGFAAWETEAEWEHLIREGEMPDGQDTAIYDNRRYLEECILRGNTRCWSKLYRRNLIGQIRFREGLSIGEDMLFLVELLPHLKRVAETPYAGYGYFQNPRGAMGRPFTPAYMDQIYCWEQARALIIKQDPALAVRADAQIMVALMLTVGKIAVLSGKERREAEEYLQVCCGKLRNLKGQKACYAWLPAGYGIKVRMFAGAPRLYVRFYDAVQKIKAALK
ncbi:MAG: glycosyltransferase [Bacteroidales bacterium]|nr:glycosyltransferase [Bacteroidales bacterium]MCM1414565.1 glycosyltransferase [bacterium]MCM1422615.1 glycosyltransferase [bacterium]